MTHSGSLGSSFTGIPGLKPSSLPIMLLQQPNLALYREQLLQQSAMMTAQAQQQQQQQQQQQRLQQGRQPSGAGPSSSTAGGAGPSKTTNWAPKRTVADLFADPANMDDITSRDIIGMLGATDSNFSGFDSVSGPLPTTGGAVDALRVQALVDAVYGGPAAPAAHANTAQTTAAATGHSSAAGANTVSVTDGMGGGGASSLCPPLAGNLGGRGAAGSSTVAGQAAAAGEVPSGGQTGPRLMAPSLPPRPSRGMKPPPDGNFDPFQAAAFHAAAAAAAAGLGPPSPPHFGNTGSSSNSTTQAGSSAAAGGSGAGLRSPAGAGDLPQAFNMAALQAAAAAFAGAANTGSAGDCDEQSDGETDAFLVGVRPAAAARAAAAVPAAAVAWGDMPDPFGAGAAGAAAAAAAATGSVAAAGVLLAGASSKSSSNRPDAQQGLSRVTRRAAAGPVLHTVAEGYEPPGQPEDVFGAAWAVAAAAAAGGGGAEQPRDPVAQRPSRQEGMSPAAAGSSAAASGSSQQVQGGLGTSAAADDSSDLRLLLLQTNKQLALLTKQLQVCRSMLCMRCCH